MSENLFKIYDFIRFRKVIPQTFSSWTNETELNNISYCSEVSKICGNNKKKQRIIVIIPGYQYIT